MIYSTVAPHGSELRLTLSAFNTAYCISVGSDDPYHLRELTLPSGRRKILVLDSYKSDLRLTGSLICNFMDTVPLIILIDTTSINEDLFIDPAILSRTQELPEDKLLVTLGLDFDLDINKPCVPVGVLHSMVANDIEEKYQGWRVPIPEDLKAFLSKHNSDAWFVWEQKLLKAAKDMSEELLTQWLGALYGPSFIRAELRGILKAKLNS